MHEVIYDKNALHFLEKLPNELQERIVLKIRATKENPKRYFEQLVKGNWKLRIGDYRVLADITDKSINITKIGHRKNVYD